MGKNTNHLKGCQKYYSYLFQPALDIFDRMLQKTRINHNIIKMTVYKGATALWGEK